LACIGLPPAEFVYLDRRLEVLRLDRVDKLEREAVRHSAWTVSLTRISVPQSLLSGAGHASRLIAASGTVETMRSSGPMMSATASRGVEPQQCPASRPPPVLERQVEPPVGLPAGQHGRIGMGDMIGIVYQPWLLNLRMVRIGSNWTVPTSQ
jgi:hypothetical protein